MRLKAGEFLIKVKINLAEGCFWKVVANEVLKNVLQKFNTNAKK